MPNPILMRRLGGGQKALPKWRVDSFDTYPLGSDLEDGTFQSGDETSPDAVYFYSPWSGVQSFIPQWYGSDDFSSYTEGSDIQAQSEGAFFDGAWVRGIVPGPGVEDVSWWLEAESIAVADGAPVTNWPDKSTFKFAAVVDPYLTPPAANPPTFKTNIINGFSVVRHTSTLKDFLNIVPAGYSRYRQLPGCSVACVLKAEQVHNGPRLLLTVEYPPIGANLFQMRLGTGAAPKFGLICRRVIGDSAVFLYDPDDFDTGWHVYFGTVNWLERRMRIYIDGVLKNEVEGVFGAAGLSDNTTDVLRSTVGHFADGFYGDRLAQSHWFRELSSTEVSTVTTHYKSKYGI